MPRESKLCPMPMLFVELDISFALLSFPADLLKSPVPNAPKTAPTVQTPPAIPAPKAPNPASPEPDS